MNIQKITLFVACMSTLALSNAFAKGDTTEKKLLSSCKGAITEYCGEVANKKDAKAIFSCLDKHEDSLKIETEHKKCYAAHEAYEKAHGSSETGEAEHQE